MWARCAGNIHMHSISENVSANIITTGIGTPALAMSPGNIIMGATKIIVDITAYITGFNTDRVPRIAPS